MVFNTGSTAKGIGLQLMNGAGKPRKLDTVYRLLDFNPSETNFNIPLSAAYYRLTNEKLQAGTANTEVTFTMNYLQPIKDRLISRARGPA
ncbi:fimbrial protein [Pseudomonas wadenswilerensis]|uniref:P pilus assembly protein, pilin FimA n=1 Tax=Pseudomonas wadenswilerensis TaxID=1785161 RepID=A0A380SZ01_9PSED|nr:hypothetical protein [Pseudomonas wadenswilerensis]SUQ62491.1 P pilus assembly protein, pilin FimA [Pseudomonas wadenswilerensis]